VSTAALSPDSQVILLLCTRLALPQRESDLKPLSRPEWNDVARAIDASKFKRPGALLGTGAASLARDLDITPALAERISALLARGGQLAIELERLGTLGIWALTRADPVYPSRLKERLKGHAPPAIFGAGPAEALHHRGIAIVGSRDVDAAGNAFASELGRLCARSRVTVFSGGARGVDKLAVDGALDEGGHGVAVLADSLQDSLRRKELRDAVLSGRLTLMTPSSPSARFTVAGAMGRNKVIYALSSAAVVVSSALDTGGTWTGATENLRAGWVPLFVRDGHDVPDGNRELIKRGGRAIRIEELESNLDAVLDAPVLHGEASLVRESGASYAAEQRAAASPADDESEIVHAADALSFVWPRLAAFLLKPRTEAEVSNALALDQAQTEVLLQRAVDQGLVRKLSNPTRFERIQAKDESQASLFET
jgi:predicted Rossmann fold nucleotide-binding protein DprA/Smf involved in DNA uptake